MRRATKCATLAFWLLLLAPGATKAQVGNGAFHVGLEGGLFETRTVTYEDRFDEVETSTQTFGLLAPVGGVVMGYQAGRMVVIGARFMFASQTVETVTDLAEEDFSTSSVAFLPFFELLLGSGASVRPYFQVGLGYANTTIEASGAKSSEGGFAFLGSFGLHAFATPSFSISPSLYLRHVSGSAEQGDVSIDRSELAFGISVGLSGWIGGEAEDEATGPSPQEEQRWVRGRHEGAGAQTGDAPSHRPAPAFEDTAASGDIVTRVALDRGSLELVGRPSRNGQLVVLRLAHLVISPTMRDCDEVQLQVGGRTLTLRDVRYRSRPEGRGIAETIHAVAPRAALEAVPQADAALIRVCSEAFNIPPFARARVGSFLERFRREAVAYDTLDDDAIGNDAPADEPSQGTQPAQPDPRDTEEPTGANGPAAGEPEAAAGEAQPAEETEAPPRATE